MNTQERKEVEERLEVIALENDGLLTPDLVVQDARDPSSPLHRHFNWDVQEAATKHWLAQARRLIRSVHIEVKVARTTIKSVAYVRTPGVPQRDQSYTSVMTIRQSEEASREVLVTEFKRIGGLLQRVQSLARLFGLEREVTGLGRNIAKLQAAAAVAPPQRNQ